MSAIGAVETAKSIDSGFAGQSVVITGASSGIGRAIAQELDRRGATLFAGSRTAGNADTLPFRNVETFEVDFASDASLDSWIDQLARRTHSIDVLVHAGGMMRRGHMENAPVSDLDLQYRVNVRAPYRLTQALLPKLRASRGQVVFVSSSAVRHARAGASQYTATKAALTAIADSLRDEVNADGVRVLTIYPGRTATPMQQRMHVDEQREWRPQSLAQPEDIAHAVVHALQLPRTAEITDLHVRPMLRA